MEQNMCLFGPRSLGPQRSVLDGAAGGGISAFIPGRGGGGGKRRKKGRRKGAGASAGRKGGRASSGAQNDGGGGVEAAAAPDAAGGPPPQNVAGGAPGGELGDPGQAALGQTPPQVAGLGGDVGGSPTGFAPDQPAPLNSFGSSAFTPRSVAGADGGGFSGGMPAWAQRAFGSSMSA
jgi:hypothetical protein